MTHAKQSLELIDWLLNVSGVTIYRISKDTKIATMTMTRIVKGESLLENLPLKTAIVLEEYASQIKKEELDKMEKIKDVISAVEDGVLRLEGDQYDVEGYVNHKVAMSDLMVYFAEKEHDEEPNGLDDMYDYDKVVAYDNGEGIVWL